VAGPVGSSDVPPSGEEREVPEPGEVLGAGEEQGVGIFPSWKWLYLTVVLYAAVLVLLLYAFTVTLDFGAR